MGIQRLMCRRYFYIELRNIHLKYRGSLDLEIKTIIYIYAYYTIIFIHIATI